MKSLSRLQFRQLFRGKKGRDLVGPAIFVVYFWILEIVLAVELGEKLPPLMGVLIFASFLIPDFLMKVIFERDHTVMDPFLKTRPVPQALWDRFLTVSQFWNPTNLLMPAIVAPACFLFLSFPLSIVVLVTLYLASVFGGFLVMLIKHRGTYQSEKSDTKKAARTFKSTTGHAIFNLQTKSVLRSKRLKTAIIYMSVLMLFFFVTNASRGDSESVRMFLFYFIMLSAAMLAQYGLGVEAGFFSAIWTRPVSISRILEDKFKMSAVMGGVSALITIPICIWAGIPAYVPVAYALFTVGFGSLIMLIDAYKCCPFDLFGKSFFNYQGTKATFKASTMLGIIVIMVVALVLPFLLSDLTASIILGGIGLVGIIFHRPYFSWVESKFLKNKHKYIEEYLSK